MLHVTNGSATAALMRRAGVAGDILPWQDVLHEGPVPASLSPALLADVRARFIAAQGWAPLDDVVDDFARRDAALARFATHDEVVLWFEHDLYDQLQLIQILDRLADLDPGPTRLSLIGIDAFPDVDRFVGLGQLDPTQLASLFPARQPITPTQLSLARDAWHAFRSPDPTAIERLMEGDTSPLPFLRAALHRHLAQFPAVHDGLGRTERQILEAINAGAATPVDVFLADQAREERPFMGDTTLWSYLYRLGADPAPLVAFAGPTVASPPAGPNQELFRHQTVSLTLRGHEVLAGRADRLAGAGIDRWLGGVHLRGADATWRWDGDHLRLVCL